MNEAISWETTTWELIKQDMLKLSPGNLEIFAIYFYNVLAYVWPQCNIYKIQLSEKESASFQQSQGGMQTGFFQLSIQSWDFKQRMELTHNQNSRDI